MSYQGGPAHDNGYWPGHDPPNPYIIQNVHPQFIQIGGTPQYQSRTNGAQLGQHWDQNSQLQYGLPAEYSANELYPPVLMQPQFQDHQFPHPIQPPQQSGPQAFASPVYQRQHVSHRQQPAAPSLKANNLLGPSQATGSQIGDPMLLISLAEEFFKAAHELAPSVATCMTTANVEAYDKLIATGLGCLDAALKRIRLPPRVEANIRLRYAGVLYEETENFMEAETALSKGITLCEMHHFIDLKYAMQFLLAQFMFKNNPKASMKALDANISDAYAYQHWSWVYVFRFLKASHALESGNLADNHTAIQNFRSIANLADQQVDRAIYLTASLMEALAHMKATGPESTEHIQRAIAAAWTYQLDADNRIPQLLGLTHILDVACSLRQGSHTQMLIKLRAMQMMMDEALKDPTWSISKDAIAIPINRTRKNAQFVSKDTRMVLAIGDDGRDNLMMSFLNKRDASAITHLLCGIVLLHKNPTDDKGLKHLETGLASLSGQIPYDLLKSVTDGGTLGATSPFQASSGILSDFVTNLQWRGQILCYFHIYMAFCLAAVADWAGVKRCIDELKATAQTHEVPLVGPLGCLAIYLAGVYHQGIGDFDTALRIFQGENFDMLPIKESNLSAADHIKIDIALLAALNVLMILQDPLRQDLTENAVLIARLEPFCTNHPNKDIQTAFNLIAATVNTNPPAQLYKIKTYLGAALAGAQTTANTQFLCITLNVMCSRFFSNVVGEQAEKSAMAASIQAKKSGNVLWMSVADGMLAQCYEVQGKKPEALATLEQARRLTEKALPQS